MADFEVFDNLGSLDGLIQGEWQANQLEVGIANWSVELGLVEENKWWRGSWSKEDVIRQVGKSATEKAIESLADKLAKFIVAGELSIQNWSDGQPSDLRLMIGPDVGMDTKKLPEDESLTRALELLKKIALQAQLHDCRLYHAVSGPALSKNNDKSNIPVSFVKAEEKEKGLEEAQKRIKELEGQVSMVHEIIAADRKTTKPVAPKVRAGASRANPTKQKRKIVEAEFESD